MSTDTAFLDDVSDSVRLEARNVAAHLPDRVPRIAEVLKELSSNPELSDLVAALAYRLVSDLAAGRNPVYTTSEAEVTPAEAARLLNVSRQFLDRQMAAGKIAYTNKPGSTHRVLKVADVKRFAEQRDGRRDGVAKAIDALLDGGAEY
ncbi:MAG: helix-turn-helix domain-containing protein [Ilumatobacteraceae bacterium]